MPFDTGVLIGNIFGCLLALPIALFLAFWMSGVKNKFAVVGGAFLGAIVGFVIVLFWVSTLHNVNAAALFFSSLIFNATMSMIFGILADLLIASKSARDYRRSSHGHGQ